MIEINVNGSVVSVQKTEALYCGAQDVHTCRFSFYGNWEQYFKTAVFRVNGRAITAVIDEDGNCILPWELLVRDNIGFDIEVGVYGVSADDEILTSVWDRIGVVREGSELGNDAREPSAGVYEQMAASIRKVDNKVTSYSAEVRTLVQRAESAAAVTEEGIEKAQDSAASAVGAAGAAERALEGVRNALDNIPAGSTVVINDLTTGGTTAALSAEMGSVLAKRPNPNLLHNGYFANPVNQRGQSLYTGTGYTIDRWRNRNANMETEQTESGLAIRNTSESSAAFFIQQFEGNLPEGEYTISILVTELSGDPRFALYTPAGGIGERLMITGTGLFSIRQSITEELAFNQIRIVLTGGSSVTVAAVKLECGSEQTLAHQDSSGNWVLNEIPDYGEELAKCQRYYQLFSSEAARPTTPADYRPNMRTTPQTGTIDIGGVTYYYADANL